MLNYVWVMFGGALGTGARFWISGLVAQRVGEFFPLGTLAVNVTGSFIIGLFAAIADPQGPFLIAPRFRQFFMIGVVGGYTTFSAFSLEAALMLERSAYGTMLAYIAASVIGTIAAVFLGSGIIRSLS